MTSPHRLDAARRQLGIHGHARPPRKAVLLARREIIDRDISELEAKLDELREGA
jgi:hypothetical protein